MLLPLEFPFFQKVIHDPYLLSFIMNDYVSMNTVERERILFILIGIWFTGSLAKTIYIVVKWTQVEAALKKWTFRGDKSAEEMLREIDSSGNIGIAYNYLITEPFLKGLMHPIIFLPDKKCTREELGFILMHEYTHWRRKDLWKKLFLNITCIIFWWNLLARFMARDYAQMIELSCDNTMSRQYSDWETLSYLQTLRHMAGGRKNCMRKKDLPAAPASGMRFSLWVDPQPLKQRFHCLIHRTKDWEFQKRMNCVIMALSIMWLVGSYYFILIPVCVP